MKFETRNQKSKILNMAKIDKINLTGESVGQIEVDNKLAEFKCAENLVHACVVAYLASQRGGNASTLTKGEVKATGAKPWRQKGTGRARAGYRSSPIWRGGGVAFGPKPHSYDKKVNKKVKRKAFYGSLADRIREGKVRIIDNWDIDKPQTKIISGLKKNLSVRKLLCIGINNDLNAALSARNIPDVYFADVGSVNVYELVNNSDIIISEAAWNVLWERFNGAA